MFIEARLSRSWRGDSKPRPRDYKSGALPCGLSQHCGWGEAGRRPARIVDAPKLANCVALGCERDRRSLGRRDVAAGSVAGQQLHDCDGLPLAATAPGGVDAVCLRELDVHPVALERLLQI